MCLKGVCLQISHTKMSCIGKNLVWQQLRCNKMHVCLAQAGPTCLPEMQVPSLLHGVTEHCRVCHRA